MPTSQAQCAAPTAPSVPIVLFPSTVPFRMGYRPWLDGVRGSAILLVLAFHMGLLAGGSFGVDVFFVLSGFLITALLVGEWQERGRINLLCFYLRRALRLFPALFALVATCGLYAVLFLSAEEAVDYRREAVVTVCYVANWPTLHRTPMPTLGHTWSLAVEEQFYLLGPVLLIGMLWLRLPIRTIAVLVFAAVIACAAYRAALFAERPPPGPARHFFVMRLYMGLDTRADALLMGCLVGLLATGNLLPQSRRFRILMTFWACVSVLALGYVFARSTLDSHLHYNGMFTLIAALVALVLTRFLIAPSWFASYVFGSRVLVGIGRISYGLYLVHIPVIHWVQSQKLGWSPTATVLLMTALSFAAAVVSYYAVERPCLRLKSRLRATIPTAPTEQSDEHRPAKLAA